MAEVSQNDGLWALHKNGAAGEFATHRVAVGELATFRNPAISDDLGRRKGESAASPPYWHRAPPLF